MRLYEFMRKMLEAAGDQGEPNPEVTLWGVDDDFTSCRDLLGVYAHEGGVQVHLRAPRPDPD